MTNHWTDIYDFLGKEKPEPFYETLDECKAVVQPLRLSGKDDFYKWRNSSDGDKRIPTDPHKRYDDWESWRDLLGKDFLTFDKCKETIKPMRFNNGDKFREWVRRKENNHLLIPLCPHKVYKEDWEGWDDFLGNDFLSYDEAKETIHPIGIKTYRDFKKWVKNEKRIPSHPDDVYGEDWEGWDGFLGRGDKFYFSLEECKKVVQSLGIQNQTNFKIWRASENGDKKIPSHPDMVYSKDWINWDDFFGKDNIRQRSKGYYFNSKTNKYRPYIFFNDKKISLGDYDKKSDAQKIRQQAVYLYESGCRDENEYKKLIK